MKTVKKYFLIIFICLFGSVTAAMAQDVKITVGGVPVVKLNNGTLMSRFGLGTFMQPSDAVCEPLNKEQRFFNMTCGDKADIYRKIQLPD